MLKLCRRVAALLLATDSCLAVRWVPSELNIADKPSRQWEHLRPRDAETRAKEKIIQKQVDQACYSGRPSGLRDASLVSRTRAAADQVPEEESWSGDGGFDRRCQVPTSKVEAAGTGRGSSVQGTDAPGDASSIETSSHRLSTKNPGIEAVCKLPAHKVDTEEEVRYGLLQVCELHVRPRLRLSGRFRNFGCHHRCLSRLRPPNPS